LVVHSVVGTAGSIRASVSTDCLSRHRIRHTAQSNAAVVPGNDSDDREKELKDLH